MDVEAVRAALRGPAAAFWAAERLNEALGELLPFGRPRVTAAAVGHLVRAGHLAYLGGDADHPDVHPDQVEALARRRDLPALLDRHVPLGPDQAAVRLGVRRVDFDRIVDLGWITPTGAVDIDYKRQGGVTRVPLYSAQDVALLPVIRPEVDWRELRTVAPGRRSPLSALAPTAEGRDTVLMAGIGRIAGVGRAAVANWRRRHPDFPALHGWRADLWAETRDFSLLQESGAGTHHRWRPTPTASSWRRVSATFSWSLMRNGCAKSMTARAMHSAVSGPACPPPDPQRGHEDAARGPPGRRCPRTARRPPGRGSAVTGTTMRSVTSTSSSGIRGSASANSRAASMSSAWTARR
ncbi:hypothetical protein [Streptomyces rochei]|uniref:Uncharacterized protein n=1 Tax=Streptomyces rochei TaxID=1928 RepID=A0AAX3ZXB7_STRRO|nr:hypothetical protein [Streptomyces rochei]WMC90933.1 hypothetical protein P7W03_35400 [Streptomyces rochei]